MNMTVNNLKIKAVSAFASMKEKVRDFFIHPGYVSGITVIELVLILVKNLALYIEYIEGEKTLKINYIHAIHKNKDKLNFLRKR